VVTGFWRGLTLLALGFALALAVGPVGSAAAHSLGASAVLLDIGGDEVDAELRLPIDQLATAIRRPLPSRAVPRSGANFLKRYIVRHVAATGKDGRAWGVEVGDRSVRRFNDQPHVVVRLRMTPPDRNVTAFTLRYDVIVAQLSTHEAFTSVRTYWDRGVFSHDPEPVGVFSSRTKELEVRAGEGSWLAGFGAVVALGGEHIAEGPDHLLFLLMLLLPAPLLASNGRWEPSGSSRASARRILHVVTAFALGHSLTLAAAALGLVDVPSRPVEILIGVSIAVSAVHAIRPLVPGGEAAIAAGFGLVHGLAFAGLLGDLGLDRASTVASLFGFNLGIELAQVIVVALVMPSLYLLSETRLAPAIRTALALFGLAAAVGWVLERAAGAANPVAPATTAMIEHPLLVAAALGAVAITARVAARKRASCRAPGSDRTLD
jgi:hypothetical protein